MTIPGNIDKTGFNSKIDSKSFHIWFDILLVRSTECKKSNSPEFDFAQLASTPVIVANNECVIYNDNFFPSGLRARCTPMLLQYLSLPSSSPDLECLSGFLSENDFRSLFTIPFRRYEASKPRL